MPILHLDPANFTPAQRTPWGGQRIIREYKTFLQSQTPHCVGESWEISCATAFPSQVQNLDDSPTLAECIQQHADDYLGSSVAQKQDTSTLLVKLIDAQDNLSLQVHPSDHDPALEAHESGKTECWYILNRNPDAGIYLGFKEGVSANDVAQCIRANEDLSQSMFFVPVKAGDFFVITPGLAHAIGKGVTLLEPQCTRPGTEGTTYRFWDWNRLYDAQGQQDAQGQARPLHRDRSLAVTQWAYPREAALLNLHRVRLGSPDLNAPPQRHMLSSTLAHPLQAEAWWGHGDLHFPSQTQILRGLTVLSGHVALHHREGVDHIDAGHSVVIPASLCPDKIILEHAHAFLSAADI